MSWIPSDDEGIVLPHLTLQAVVGITVSIAGNVLISFALNLQKLAHLRLDRERQNGLPDTEREGRPPGRDTNGRHLAHQASAPHFVAGQQATGEDHTFEAQPLIPKRSQNHAPSSSYGLSGYNSSIAGDDSRSRRSSVAAHARLRQRKQPFVSHFLPLRFVLRRGSPNSSSTRPESSTLPADDSFFQRNTRTNHRDMGKVPSIVRDEKESDYLRSKLWWSGFVLMNIGETGNFISYAFAPASVVAPLGTFALVANCFFAPLLLKERFRLRDVVGILLAIIGATTVVFSSPSSDGPPPVLTSDALLEAITQRPFVIFSIVYLVLAVLFVGLSEGSIGRRMVVIDVGLCALFGGFTVLATKAISTLLTEQWVEMMTEWITYPILAVLVITGVLQIRYLNRALKRFDAKIVIPTQFVFFTLSAVVGSAVLYGDFRRASFHEMLTFLYGCAATFTGVFVIASSPSGNTSEQVHDEERHDPGGRREVASRIDSLGVQSHSGQGTPRADAREIPVLRHKHSTVSLVGYTPVQNLLLAHTPPRDRERGRAGDTML